MALTVWKQQLLPDEQDYSLPKGARLMSVAFQRGAPCLWYLCDPSAEREIRRILFTGTGNDIAAHGDLKFIGTMLTEDQNFVFHAFERVSAWM